MNHLLKSVDNLGNYSRVKSLIINLKSKNENRNFPYIHIFKEHILIFHSGKGISFLTRILYLNCISFYRN